MLCQAAVTRFQFTVSAGLMHGIEKSLYAVVLKGDLAFKCAQSISALSMLFSKGIPQYSNITCDTHVASVSLY